MGKERDCQLGDQWFEARMQGFMDLAMLKAALDLGLYEHLGVPRTPAALSSVLRIAPERLAPLLDALCRLGVLADESDAFVLTELGRKTLAAGSFVRGGLTQFAATAADWLELASALGESSPRPPRAWPTWGCTPSREPFAERTRWVARELAACIPLEEDAAATMVDAGCGEGVFARAMLQRFSRLRAVLLDRQPIVDRALAAMQQAGLAARCQSWAGELADYPHREQADVVLLSNVLHAYAPAVCADLVRQAASLLRGGGILAVRDLRLDRTGQEPRVASDFALTQALLGGGGRVYSRPSVQGWLKAAGLDEVREEPAFPRATGSFLVLGRRPAR